MNRSHIHLSDLPVEILFKIFNKLNNMDVLYSFIGVQRLELIARDKTFIDTLNFVLNNDGVNYSMKEPILNRFCHDILPQIHSHIRYLILETTTMERILRAGVYSNLTQLKIFGFHANFFSSFCTDELFFRSNFKKQITDLTVINDQGGEIGTLDETTNVFIKLLDFFENLNYMNSIGTYTQLSPILSFVDLPSTSFVSSNLTKLSVLLDSFGDALCLLDGRLNQLTTFIVIIVNIKEHPLLEFNSNDLSNLEYFSLRYGILTNQYDTQVVPLLRRMRNLQQLTLYIEINDRNTPVDGTQIENEVLIPLSKLQSFVFYIGTFVSTNHIVIPLSNDDIQRSFINVKFGSIGCGMNHIDGIFIAYHVFSLPFTFANIRFIGNCLTDTVFRNVTCLCIIDQSPFEHEFFLRLTRCFPSLASAVIKNCKGQSRDAAEYENDGSLEIARYLHLKSLSLVHVHTDYVEQMLNESKTRLPRLTELRLNYDQLKTVTDNFTRDATRLNFINVKQLMAYRIGDRDDIDNSWINAQSKDFHIYFPSLEF